MDPQRNEARWARLTALLRPIHGQALATARRLSRSNDEGDDLYQEAVLRAFQKLDGLREESRFRSWFFAVLLNRHRSRARVAVRDPVPLEGALAPGEEPAGEDGSSWDEDRWRAERAARALARLAPVEREAVVLFDIEGFSIAEVAELTQTTQSAVKSRLGRGREKLRRFYRALEGTSSAHRRYRATGDPDPRVLHAPGESS